jgi:hypothetical protein
MLKKLNEKDEKLPKVIQMKMASLLYHIRLNRLEASESWSKEVGERARSVVERRRIPIKA